MSDLVIRTDKHVTITEAHPYHRYLRDDRDRGGNALVEKAFDPRCPLCREEEDSGLLRHAGLLGHEFVGIAGAPGERRTVCECDSLDDARRLCQVPTLTVYRRGARKTWHSCYDRSAELLAKQLQEGGGP